MQKNICPNCGKEVPAYEYKCPYCGSFLRERVFNIDLWDTIWKLFYSPVEAFRKIVFAEHKNYTIIFSILFGIKFFLTVDLATLLFKLRGGNLPDLLKDLLIFSLLFVLTLILFSLFFKIAAKIFKEDLRFKDFYSILIFSFSPLVFVLFIIFPFEYALFGNYWFTFNPPPFILRPAAAYLLIGVEGLLTFWCLLNLIIGLSYYFSSKVKGIIAGGILIGVLFYLTISSPFTL